MKDSFLKLKEYFLNKNTQNKIVYRFISKSEKQAIDNQDIENLGGSWNKKNYANTHRYQKNTKYLHFIDNRKDAMIVYNELGFKRDYFCAYSIPVKILRKYRGKGHYSRGYEFYDTIKEYAIPSDQFDPQWLISTKTIEEFLDEESCKTA